MNTATTIRVRFAPSPTGFLHVGGLRTALYNYLFARKNGGAFLLRIEDTDRSRYVEGAVENLIATLAWAGLHYDEGPEVEGNFGPYLQSQRLEIYRKHAHLLIGQGNAYYCFCTPERLENMRKEQERLRQSPRYDRKCLSLSKDEIEGQLSAKVPHVIRMKVPDTPVIRFQDLVRGEVEFSSQSIDDQVLIKSDGYPTYHLANVVDDHLMEISHVIRGEEWLSSTPKHVILYDFFGWRKPQFAHLPLLLNPDRSKLSKRQGDVAVEDYRRKGYFPEALVNFVAMLGWNPGTEQEIFSMDELVDQFSLDRVNKAGAIFNLEKLNWLNFEHLRRKSEEEILSHLKALLSASTFADTVYSDSYLLSVIRVMRDRVNFVEDFLTKSPYFFESPKIYEEKNLNKRWNSSSNNNLSQYVEAISTLNNPTKSDFEKALIETAKALGIENAELIHPVRLAVTGVGGGPGLFDVLEILGKDEVIHRLKIAIQKIPHLVHS